MQCTYTDGCGKAQGPSPGTQKETEAQNGSLSKNHELKWPKKLKPI